jgi:pimeloyl-ACP methyl ester carboxylesterase
MNPVTTRPVVFLPGAIMPASAQYGPLLSALNGSVQPLLKDLEVYAQDAPPLGYELDLEVESLMKASQDFGFHTFHLVGYSGGGAIALAFIATYPEKVRSLALSEPAVIPSPEWLRQEAQSNMEMERIMALPQPDQMREFVRIQLRPGIQPPPPPAGELPPWMAQRPAGLKALQHAFNNSIIAYTRFSQFHKPVYLAIGSLSNPIEERKADVMARLFPDFQVEVYADRHHFDPPQRAEPDRFARALDQLWARADQNA